MGRGTVAGGGAAGLYSLALDVGKAERDAAVAKLDARLNELTPKIAELQAALEAAEAARDEARGLAQAAISAYADAMRADPEGDHQVLADEVQARIEVAVRLEGEAAKVRIPLEEAQAEKAQLEKDRLAQLAVPVERTVSAWCVDLTEDASGQVATIEVPGEPARLLIAPGGRAPAAADGRLLARGVMSPAQAFWNAAVLPGWQKWKPDYRTGTLTALDQDNDRATVELDDLTSSAQGLRVNQAIVLTDVPVVYMTCNAQAFEVGDRVVVQFDGRNWANPRVIGFVQNPKACEAWGWGIAGGGYLRSLPWNAGEAAGPVAYRWRPTPPDGGNVSWYGNGKTVSWWGRVGKHVGVHIPARVVYCDGVALNFGMAIDYVRGACARVIDGVVWVYALGRRVTSLPTTSFDRLYRMRLTDAFPTLVWERTCASVDGTLSELPSNAEPVMFDPAGERGVSVAYRWSSAQVHPVWVVEYTDLGRFYERVDPQVTTTRTYTTRTGPVSGSCEIVQTLDRVAYTGQVVAVDWGLDGERLTAVVDYLFEGGGDFEGAEGGNATAVLRVGEVQVARYALGYARGPGSVGVPAYESWDYREQLLALDLRNPLAACTLVRDTQRNGLAYGGPCGATVLTNAGETALGLRLVGAELEPLATVDGSRCLPFLERSYGVSFCEDVSWTPGTTVTTHSLFSVGDARDANFWLGGRLGLYAYTNGGLAAGWYPGPRPEQFCAAFGPNGDVVLWCNGFVPGLDGFDSTATGMWGEFTDGLGKRFASNAFGLEAFEADANKTLDQLGAVTVLTR